MGNRTERFNNFRLELNAAKSDADKAAIVREFTLQERLMAILNAIATQYSSPAIAQLAFERIFRDPRYRELTEYMLATPAEKLANYLNEDRRLGDITPRDFMRAADPLRYGVSP